MPRAIWKDTVIAETDEFERVEGNIYFPPNSVNRKFLEESSTHTMCPWKGTASYYDIVVDGERLDNAGWYYPDPKERAAQIKDYVAFWKGVQIEP